MIVKNKNAMSNLSVKDNEIICILAYMTFCYKLKKTNLLRLVFKFVILNFNIVVVLNISLITTLI